MKRRVICTPVETVTYVLLGARGEEKEIDCTFNNDSLIILINEFGDMSKLFMDYEKKPYDLAAILLYCGSKTSNYDITLDDCKGIIVGSGSDIVAEITQQFADSMFTRGGDETIKKFKEEMGKIGMKDTALKMLNNFQ